MMSALGLALPLLFFVTLLRENEQLLIGEKERKEGSRWEEHTSFVAPTGETDSKKSQWQAVLSFASFHFQNKDISSSSLHVLHHMA